MFLAHNWCRFTDWTWISMVRVTWLLKLNFIVVSAGARLPMKSAACGTTRSAWSTMAFISDKLLAKQKWPPHGGPPVGRRHLDPMESQEQLG
jgi:hypothetical protein